MIKQREGRFNLEVMGSAAAASRLLVELPCPLRWQGFEGKTFDGRARAAANAASAAPSLARPRLKDFSSNGVRRPKAITLPVLSAASFARLRSP